jgi:tetratricopeptide (TPR) repeat protein
MKMSKQRRMMRSALSLAVCLLSFSAPLAAQEPDSARIGIHQSEAELHRWDVLKTHPSVPQLQKGADLARQGSIKGAIRAFQAAAPGRKSFAYFNLGVVYFETGNLHQALRYLQLSHRARKDSVCLEYLQNARRLVKERKHRQ